MEDEEVPKVCETIMESARTGRFGDGKFVLPVEESYRVRTGEKDLEAFAGRSVAGTGEIESNRCGDRQNRRFCLSP